MDRRKPQKTPWVKLMLWVYVQTGILRSYLFKKYVTRYNNGIIEVDPQYVEDKHTGEIVAYRTGRKIDKISIKDAQL